MTANKLEFIDGNLLFSYDDGTTETAIKGFVQVTGVEMLEGNLIRVIRQNGSDFYTFDWRKITKLIGKSGVLAALTSKEAFYKILFEEFLVATSGENPEGAATEEKQEEIIDLLNYFATKTDNQPVVSKNSFFSDIARGKISGVENFKKAGSNTSVSTTQRLLCASGQPIVPLTTAAKITFLSSNANDNATGTGARIIRIFGVGVGGESQTEDLTLNGTNPVVTTNNWLGILNRVQVISAGTNLTNLGTISGTNGGNTYCTIPIGVSLCKQLAYYVPKGKTALVYSYVFDGSKNSGSSSKIFDIFFYTLKSGVKYELFNLRIDYTSGTEVFINREYETPLPFTENTIWWVEAKIDSGTAWLDGEMEQVIFDN